MASKNNKTLPPQSQKTLFNFFNVENKSVEENVICSLCGEYSTKLIWHRDFECVKAKIPKRLSVKNNRCSKRILNSKNTLKDLKGKNNIDVIILDDSDSENPFGTTNDPEDHKRSLLLNNCSKRSRSSSPKLFSLDSYEEEVEREVTDKVIKREDSDSDITKDDSDDVTEKDSDDDVTEENSDNDTTEEDSDSNETKDKSYLQQLKDDWGSSEKSSSNSNQNFVQLKAASKKLDFTLLPLKERNEEQKIKSLKRKVQSKRILENSVDIEQDDFEECTITFRSPSQKGRCGNIKKQRASSLSNTEGSDQEFEEPKFAFRSPVQSPSKNSLSSKVKNQSLINKLPKNHAKASNIIIKNNSESDEKEFSNSNFKGVRTEKVNVQENELESDLSSSGWYSPVNSPCLVSPQRTPTPTPKKQENFNDTIHNKSLSISSKVLASPQNYALDKTLTEYKNVEKILTPENVERAMGSPTYKTTPRSIYKSLQKSSLGCTGSFSPKITARRNLSSFMKESKPDSEREIKQIKSFNSPNSQNAFAQNFRNHKGIYLENFLNILDNVLSQPDDLQLFNKDDLNAIKVFNGLSLQAKKLYVRLFQRKTKWHKFSKIYYKDICDQEDTYLYINELVYAEFLFSEDILTNLYDILNLLSVDEVRGLCREMKLIAVGKRDLLVSRLMKLHCEQKTIASSFITSSGKLAGSIILKKAKALANKCCLINKDIRSVFMRVLMLYSLVRCDEEEDGGQQAQLTTLLMVSLGKMNFPSYKVIRKHCLFRSRDDVLTYEKCLHLDTEAQECIEKQQWQDAINMCNAVREICDELRNNEEILNHDKSLPPFLRRFTSISLLIHTLTTAVDAFQRLKQYGKAVKQLEYLICQETHLQDYKGRWYDRLALNLDQHLKKPRKSLEAIKAALEDPEVRVGHRLSLCQRAERLLASSRCKAFAKDFEGKFQLMTYEEPPKMFIQAKSLPSDIPGYKRVYITNSQSDVGDQMICSVEELVISHYKTLGYSEGLHCEGQTVHALFGLFFWEAIYYPHPDAFRSPHQAVPLDLNSPEFYISRKLLIKKRLNQLENWSLEEAHMAVNAVWNEYEGTVCIVNWKIFKSLNHVQGLISGLGLMIIAAICRRLAKDHRFTRSGFPDLIVWNPSNKISRIIEVKGPNDRLSTKQILWLDYLLKHGAAAEVCHVEAVGAKRLSSLKSRRESPRKKTEFGKPNKTNNKKRSSNMEDQGEEDFFEEKKYTNKRTRKRKTKDEGNKKVLKKCKK